MCTGLCKLHRLLAVWGVLAAPLAGCSSTQTTNTARSASEQLLVSNAVDYSLDKVDFTPVYGQKVYLEEKYVDCIDKNYLIASVRHRVMKAGGRLVDKADESDIVMEMRSGGVGTNTSESFVGVPEVTLPGMVTLPEVRFLERKMQRGTAKIGLVAYDTKTREILGTGGTSLARSDDSNWFFVGVGPIQTGTVRKEVERGTSGPASIVRDRLPPTVAFASPANRTGAGVEYAAEPPPVVPPIPDVSPASANQRPDWYQQ